MSCFSRRRKENVTNLITLDGMSHFPKEFLDLKAFNSNKACVIADTESSQEDMEKTANGLRDASASINPPPIRANGQDRLLGTNEPDRRLINVR